MEAGDSAASRRPQRMKRRAVVNKNLEATESQNGHQCRKARCFVLSYPLSKIRICRPKRKVTVFFQPRTVRATAGTRQINQLLPSSEFFSYPKPKSPNKTLHFCRFVGGDFSHVCRVLKMESNQEYPPFPETHFPLACPFLSYHNISR